MMNTLNALWAASFLHVYAAAGAIILWSKLGRAGRREVWVLSGVLGNYLSNEQTRKLVEPLVFVSFGTFLAVGILHPATEGQALAAGLGWTSLASK
jgi:hypothetical protein